MLASRAHADLDRGRVRRYLSDLDDRRVGADRLAAQLGEVPVTRVVGR